MPKKPRTIPAVRTLQSTQPDPAELVAARHPTEITGKPYQVRRPVAQRSYTVTREIPFKRKDGTVELRKENVQAGDGVLHLSPWGPGGLIAGFIKPDGRLAPAVRRLVPTGPLRITGETRAPEQAPAAPAKRGRKPLFDRAMTQKERDERKKALKKLSQAQRKDPKA